MAIPSYQEALQKAGHKYSLKFQPPSDPPMAPRKRNRKRKETFFTPPYSKTIKTNVGKEFFTIVDSCFPPENPLSKIFNRHTVKFSYSCMPNIGRLITGHNKKILKDEELTGNKCNCRVPGNCPLENNCLLDNVIYQATVKRLDTQKEDTYIGLTSKSFKERWNNHKTSFRLQSHKNESKLSVHIWDLKSKGVGFEPSWRIMAKTNSYSPTSKKCWLCIKEKHFKLFEPRLASLNMRHEKVQQATL